jgi:hypothetical protein
LLLNGKKGANGKRSVVRPFEPSNALSTGFKVLQKNDFPYNFEQGLRMISFFAD